MRNAAPNLDTAREWHGSLNKLLKQQGRHTTRGAATKRRLAQIEDVWNALTQREAPRTEAGKAVALTMDPEDVFVMMGCDGIPAAFALEQMLAHLPGNAQTGEFADDGFELRAACRQAWGTFEKARDAAERFKLGFGCGDAPAWMTVKSVGEFGDAELVGRVADLAGKMYEAMRGKVRVLKPSKAEYDVAGVTTGGDLNKLLPHELLKLGHPVMQDIAAMRILQKRADQLQMKGWEYGNRGPLVICIDESASMEDDYHGTGRNTWAKACAAAMARVAHEQGRIVRVVHYSTGTFVRELKPGDHVEMLQMVRCFLDGSTDIPLALKRARGEVGDLEREGHRGADIVMVTDGECYEFDAINGNIDQMDSKGIKLWTVGIQLRHGEYRVRDEHTGQVKTIAHPLKARAELYVHVDALNVHAVQGLEEACLDNEARELYRAKYGKNAA